MKTRTAVTVSFFLIPSLAIACGSMGLDDPRTRTAIVGAVFVPMIALIPLEMGLLQWLGKLQGRVIKAYLACLPAKVAGVVGVALAAQADLIDSMVVHAVVAVELAYSLGHFVIALLVLKFGFRLERWPLLLASLSISTVIPWLYSLGFWSIAVAAG